MRLRVWYLLAAAASVVAALAFAGPASASAVFTHPGSYHFDCGDTIAAPGTYTNLTPFFTCSTGDGITIVASGVTLNLANGAIEGLSGWTGSGVYVAPTDSTGAGIQNVVIENGTVEPYPAIGGGSGGDYGVYIDDAAGVTVQAMNLYGQADYGVFAQGTDSGQKAASPVIYLNDIEPGADCSAAVGLYNTAAPTINNNLIAGDTFGDGSCYAGIRIGAASSNAVISNNTIDAPGEYGIVTHGVSGDGDDQLNDITISGNVLNCQDCAPTTGGSSPGPANASTGIKLPYGVTSAAVTGNTISYFGKYGIHTYMNASDMFSYNVLQNNGDALDLEWRDQGDIISNNYFNQSTSTIYGDGLPTEHGLDFGYGVIDWGSSFNVYSGNNAQGNEQDGFLYNSTSDTANDYGCPLPFILGSGDCFGLGSVTMSGNSAVWNGGYTLVNPVVVNPNPALSPTLNGGGYGFEIWDAFNTVSYHYSTGQPTSAQEPYSLFTGNDAEWNYVAGFADHRSIEATWSHNNALTNGVVSDLEYGGGSGFFFFEPQLEQILNNSSSYNENDGFFFFTVLGNQLPQAVTGNNAVGNENYGFLADTPVIGSGNTGGGTNGTGDCFLVGGCS